MRLNTLVRRIRELPQITGPLEIRALVDERGEGFLLLRTDETPAVEVAVVRDTQERGYLEARDYATLLSGSTRMLPLLLAVVRRWGRAWSWTRRSTAATPWPGWVTT